MLLAILDADKLLNAPGRWHTYASYFLYIIFLENKHAMMQHDKIKASTLDMAGPYQTAQEQNFGTITENQENHGHQQNLVTNRTCTSKNHPHPTSRV